MAANPKATSDLSIKWRLQHGRMIRRMRLEAGLRQADVAEFVGVSIQSVSFVETGRMFLPAERAHSFAEVLGVNLQTLCTDLLKFSNPWLWVGIFPNADKKLERQLQRHRETLPRVALRGPASPQ